MKTWLVCLFVMVVLIGLGMKVQHGMERDSAVLLNKLGQVQDRANARQWPDAAQSLDPLIRKWEDTRPRWALFIHHQEIDTIDSALIRLLRAVKSENFADFQTSSGELGHFLQHIPERDKFNVINIF
jgi:hypothetical protein